MKYLILVLIVLTGCTSPATENRVADLQRQVDEQKQFIDDLHLALLKNGALKEGWRRGFVEGRK